MLTTLLVILAIPTVAVLLEIACEALDGFLGLVSSAVAYFQGV